MSWIPFINQELGDSGPKLCVWVQTLVIDHLLPALATKGYVLTVNGPVLIGCILNVLYRHNQDVNKMRATTYMCYHGRASRDAFDTVLSEYEAALEDRRLRRQPLMVHPIVDRQELFDFFLAYKCSQEFWDTLRSKVSVERYADTSDFANRIWNDLPMIIYWHIDHDKSVATDEFDHMFLDSEDENDSESSPEESGTKD
jgi:hypothetical protein